MTFIILFLFGFLFMCSEGGLIIALCEACGYNFPWWVYLLLVILLNYGLGGIISIYQKKKRMKNGEK